MKAAVLGSPIAHSLSPVLHRAAYRALDLHGWTYQAIECDEARLPHVLADCGPDWAGLSLTMPLKRRVLSLLDTAEPLVADVGAANTVVFRDGARHGYNTDVPGMVAALGAPLTGAAAEVVVLGAGATACSALAAVRTLGGHLVTVAARDPARAGALQDTARKLGMTVRLTSFTQPGHPAPELLISTVPAGAADPWAHDITTGKLKPRRLFDVVYHPWPTPLTQAAQAQGALVTGGFELLLHQAACQVGLMTALPAPLEPMRTAGLTALAGAATPPGG